MTHWRDLAACQGIFFDMFFNDGQGTGGETHEIKMVKRVCEGCEVRRQCLDSALYAERADHSRRYGIFGGLTPRQRRDLWSDLVSRRTVTRCPTELHIMEGDNVYVDPSGRVDCHECRRDRRTKYDARRAG